MREGEMREGEKRAKKSLACTCSALFLWSKTFTVSMQPQNEILTNLKRFTDYFFQLVLW